MLDQQDAHDVIGSTAYGTDGEKLGTVGQLYLDDDSERPEFVAIDTGLFGTRETLVPVADATLEGDRLALPFTTEAVKGAPNVDPADGHLAEDDEELLHDYYGLARRHDDPAQTATAGSDAPAHTAAGTGDGPRSSTDGGTDGSTDDVAAGGLATSTVTDAGRDTSGTNGDDSGATGGPARSEEPLDVDTTTQETGRAQRRT